MSVTAINVGIPVTSLTNIFYKILIDIEKIFVYFMTRMSVHTNRVADSKLARKRCTMCALSEMTVRTQQALQQQAPQPTAPCIQQTSLALRERLQQSLAEETVQSPIL
mgnify:CR=1 FL=1